MWLMRRLPSNLGGEQGEQGLQRGDLLGAGPTGLGDSGWQVEEKQLRQEQEQASGPTQEASTDGRRLGQDSSDRWHFGAIFGPRPWRRRWPRCRPVGQPGPLQQAKEIGLTEVVSFAGQLVADVLEGIAEPAQFAGAVANGLTFRGRPAATVGGLEEAVEIWLSGEVADDGSDGIDVELVALGQRLGSGVFKEIAATDLVMSLGGGERLLEEAGQVIRACHESWVPKRQVGGRSQGPRRASWGRCRGGENEEEVLATGFSNCAAGGGCGL
jgi:hypothetical protein